MRVRWSILATMVIGVALYAAAPAGASAPMGTLTVDKAHRTGANAPRVKGAALPRGAFTNRPTIPMSAYRAAKAQRGPDRRPGAPAHAPRTAANLLGFNGITQATAQDSFPPDINGSVSSNRVAEIVNQHLTAFTKTGSQTSDRSLATLTGYSAQGIFDPRIMYDPTWKRWVFIAEAFPESAGVQQQFIGISSNSSPDGGFIVYQFNINGACGSGNFWDYPQLGMNQDAVVITGNCFQGNTYLGARTLGVAKALLYNGLGFSVPIFFVPTGDSTTTPSQVFDQNPHMDMLTRNGPHQIRFNNPANAFYSAGLTDSTITGFAAPSVPRDAGQAGCSAASCTLDTGDGRFQAPGVEFGTSLFNVATYGLSGNGTFATPTWGEFNTSTHATVQSGNRFADSCSDDFNASLTASNDSHVWLNWTSTDPQGSGCGQTFVRQYVATRRSSDAAGTLPSIINPFTSPAELTGNFDGNFGTQRWGDTSSVSRDPSNATIAWTWNESVANSSTWGTRAHKIRNTP